MTSADIAQRFPAWNSEVYVDGFSTPTPDMPKVAAWSRR